MRSATTCSDARSCATSSSRSTAVIAIDGVPFADLGRARHESEDDRPVTSTVTIERGDRTIDVEVTTGLLVR